MKTKTIDMTPTWESLALNIAHLAILGETFDSINIGKTELLRMARLADRWTDHQKQLARKKSQSIQRKEKSRKSLEKFFGGI